jgi:hypothetical protein
LFAGDAAALSQSKEEGLAMEEIRHSDSPVKPSQTQSNHFFSNKAEIPSFQHSINPPARPDFGVPNRCRLLVMRQFHAAKYDENSPNIAKNHFRAMPATPRPAGQGCRTTGQGPAGL